MIFNIMPEDYVNQLDSEDAEIWATMDNFNTPEGDNNQEDEVSPPPGLFSTARTDSINSQTLFVNPNLIQPVNTHRYTGIAVQQQQPQQQLLQQQLHIFQQQQQQHQQQQQQHSDHELPSSAEDMVRSLVSDRRLSVTEDGSLVYVEVEETGGYQGHQGVQYQIMNEGSSDSFKVEGQNGHQISGGHGSHDRQSNGHGNGHDMPGSSGMRVEKQEFMWSSVSFEKMEPSPTGKDISYTDYPGQFQFDVSFTKPSNATKNSFWEFSERLNKLYIDMNKYVQVEFKIGCSPPPNLRIRALPVFSEASYIREPVKRCPNHSSVEDPSNIDFSYTHHLIRFQTDNCKYVEDVESGRLSVYFNVGTPHQGMDVCTQEMKFMCLGSDIGGINRRPVKLVFTLELEGRVVGRKVVDVRICSCPRRDKVQEEKKLEELEAHTRRMAQRFATNTVVPPPLTQVSLKPPPGKKRKMDAQNTTIIMVPVHADDFKKLNEFAEAAWVVRDPGSAETIRETRRQLLTKHNADLIKKVEKKPYQ